MNRYTVDGAGLVRDPRGKVVEGPGNRIGGELAEWMARLANSAADGARDGPRAKMTKDDWMVATTCVGSAMALAPAGTPEADRRLGLGLAGFSQRLPDEVWNRAAEGSEGMLEPVAPKRKPGDYFARDGHVYLVLSDGIRTERVLVDVKFSKEEAEKVAATLEEARSIGSHPERFTR